MAHFTWVNVITIISLFPITFPFNIYYRTFLIYNLKKAILSLRVANRTKLAMNKTIDQVEQKRLKVVPEEFKVDAHH